ncbi:uncharacterized protein LOC110461445 [Mizuhopecten yessoensis]|uniref:Steryl-sulfatase n=1 Tax=Mizuhopecten yessoensis TaxID=6573 RepID=A0A210Q0B6_MIZYE|nr:uncharacterized protein LOC110461445 [Mizuhopecten yessoensis]OWF42190.1 Steryl-sulfatase [Mizuhopecten yessoensis]
MAEDTAIEKHIKSFVSNKIGESVYLDLSKSKFVIIKHKIKTGSISLASLWVRVLQHRNNYPVQRYPYRTLYEANGNQKISLKIDDVTMTVFLSTGTLMIQGNFVLEWFTKRFEDILRNYDAPDGPSQPVLAMFTQYQNQWESLLDREKKAADEASRKQWEREEVALCKADELPVTVKQTFQEADMSDQEEDNRTLQQLELVRLDQLEEEDLDSQLEKLRQGCVLDGPTVVYPLWKSLLDCWFSNQTNKVYLATPFLDTVRLSDVCHLVLKHKLTANLEAFYVRQNCDHKLQISDVKRNTQNRLEPKDQVFIEYKVYNRIVYPLKKFHTKFLACVSKGQAQVVVTSANFHADHFHFPNLESVQFLTMTEAEFIHRYLRTIQASQLEVTIQT